MPGKSLLEINDDKLSIIGRRMYGFDNQKVIHNCSLIKAELFSGYHFQEKRNK